ncbi:sensor histidine kinase [Saccharomonospora azurea]|uniref:histidine kinase n=1 Tax=Saccharomonospora azurea NA-128 TaxID=882081 RepID=H8G3J0_9PSEU|nr:HAMP domain-containing sensor histidine kinase [Saccharomonospora azurea]EHK81851.1 signal transduction histidine kinase [Saccharomonospora azurea SZMC 14600]EHY88048.1 signal transduction histidine kinase [Saccharomonospora azurea NA-128]
MIRRTGLPARTLRARVTVLATSLVAVVSVLLLWLAWRLVGDSVAAVPQLPPGTLVQVDGVDVEASVLAEHLQEQARQRMVVAGLSAFGFVVTAAGILAWTLTSHVLRPLREITDTARRLSVESMGERIGDVRTRDELAELAHTFDAMLDRLQAAFDAQRHFVANASHELRTPLAVIRTELDVTLSDDEADEAELRRMAGVVRDATDRAERLVNALLLLARTDGAELPVTERVHLGDVVESAWQAVRAGAEDKGVTARFDLGEATTTGDPALLERVAGNLVENAVTHNVENGWIEVTTRRGDGPWVVLTVRSSGGVIAADDVAGLFEPFRRAGVARTARTGAGLGLSIVQAAVRAHGGSVRAEPVPDGGLAVTVLLPAA